MSTKHDDSPAALFRRAASGEQDARRLILLRYERELRIIDRRHRPSMEVNAMTSKPGADRTH